MNTATETTSPGKEDAQENTNEPLAGEPGSEKPSNAPLLTLNSILRLLADIEAKPAAGIAAVAAVLVLSLFGRVGSLVIGLLAGLLIHAAIERRRETIQWHTRAAFTPEPLSVIHAREVFTCTLSFSFQC